MILKDALFKSDKEGDSIASELFCGGKLLRVATYWNSPDNEDDEFLKDLAEGEYILGIEVVSNNWLSVAFCRKMYRFELILVEAQPLGEGYVKYKFQHTRFDGPTRF